MIEIIIKKKTKKKQTGQDFVRCGWSVGLEACYWRWMKPTYAPKFCVRSIYINILMQLKKKKKKTYENRNEFYLVLFLFSTKCKVKALDLTTLWKLLYSLKGLILFIWLGFIFHSLICKWGNIQLLLWKLSKTKNQMSKHKIQIVGNK